MQETMEEAWPATVASQSYLGNPGLKGSAGVWDAGNSLVETPKRGRIMNMADSGRQRAVKWEIPGYKSGERDLTVHFHGWEIPACGNPKQSYNH